MRRNEPSPEAGVEVHERYRPLLFSIAYRMLGSVSDSEDILQEAFVRWQRASANEEIHSPKSYLSSLVTHLCIDQLRSAKVRREKYVGSWLPEPLLSEGGPEADDALPLDESLSMAFLVLLESLSPVERAVFVLREVWDMEELLRLLSEDVILYSDGGGKARAPLRPIYGADKVARFLVGVLDKEPPTSIDLVRVNGEPAIVAYDPEGRPVGVVALEVSGAV